MSSIEFGRLLPEYTHSSTLSVLGKDKNNDPGVKTCIQAMCQFSRLRIKDYGWHTPDFKDLYNYLWNTYDQKNKTRIESPENLQDIYLDEHERPDDDITVLNEPILAPGGNSNP
nr:14946_t:CDS:2 [Entrophospora candida]